MRKSKILFRQLKKLRWLAAILYADLSGQIQGPGAIHPGAVIQYFCPGGQTGFACNNCPPGSQIVQQSGFVSVTAQETMCQIALNSACGNKAIVVLPFINPMTVFPGEAVTATLHDNCNGVASNMIGSVCNYAYNWNVSPPNCCASNPCNLASSSVQILVPIVPSFVPAAVTMNCSINCVPTATPILTVEALPPVIFPVKLRTPVITGPGCLGCDGCPLPNGNIVLSSNFIFGAGYYDWSFVSGSGVFSIASGQGTQNITLNALGAGVAVIKVKAYTDNPANTPKAHSEYSSNFVITACCLPNVNVTANVNSPNSDTQQAAVNITASNMINNGGAAMYHAASKVRLINGFNAKQGSYFHGYLQNCTGNYYRVSETNQNEEEENREETILLENLQTNTNEDFNRPAVNQILTSDEVLVFPNPTTGNLNINFTKPSNSSLTASVENVTGYTLIKQKLNSSQNKIQINLDEFTNGIYILKIIDENGNLVKVHKVVLSK